MRAPWVLVSLGGVGLVLTSCATSTPPQKFRTYFAPPVRQVPKSTPTIDPPGITTSYFANEVPNSQASIPSLPRPGDVDFLIKRADERFVAGKRAYLEGRFEDARKEFDRALEILLTAPDNLPDRSRLEQHLEELTEGIYRYDVDQASFSEPEGDGVFEQSPLDSILNMTFPVDPSLRNKVEEQIRATASQLPLEENDAVVSFINFFSSSRGSKIIAAGLRRSGRYKPMIERVLQNEGVPQELIFLAQAESGFSPRAISRARCIGLWQFAAFRGREYGLNQTPATDDRMDPERATRAAARHLHDLYNHFGDWYLAMAAYNCGPGCIDRAIERTGYADFWQLRRLGVLPKETSNYVPAILAMTIVGKNAKDYGLDGLDFDAPMEYDTIELPSSTHLGLVAEALDRPISELRELNPSLLRTVAPSGYTLHLPKGTLDEVQAVFDVVPKNRRDSWRAHRLESGETFPALAKRFNTASTLVSSANHDELPEPGSWVVIPVSYPGDRIASRNTQSSRTPAKGRSRAHTAAPKTASQPKSGTKPSTNSKSVNRASTRRASANRS